MAPQSDDGALDVPAIFHNAVVYRKVWTARWEGVLGLRKGS